MSFHSNIEELATTNARIALSLVMIFALFITWLVGTMLHRIGPAELESLKWLALTVSVWAGLDVTQYIGKRITEKPEVIDAQTRQAAVTGSVPPPPPSSAAAAPASPDVQKAAITAALPEKGIEANTPQRALTSEGLPRPIRAG